MITFKKTAIVAIPVIFFVLIYFGFKVRNVKKEPVSSTNPVNPVDEVKKMIKLTSPVFNEGGEIPVKYTCNGENINPPLIIENIPDKAVSLALIVDDPDAPSGIFVHWLIWNIDPKITNINEGQVPTESVQGLNGVDKGSYTGPCPPSGTHRYQFKLYALDNRMNLGSNTKRADLENAMKDHILDSALLTGLYSRK